MRLSFRPQQRAQSANAILQAPISQSLASVSKNRRKSLSSNKLLLQTISENSNRFTTPAKVQIFEWPTTRNQHFNIVDSKYL